MACGPQEFDPSQQDAQVAQAGVAALEALLKARK
jgi:hypothetical protein